MDPKLSNIYGTNQTTEADAEKLAAAELAETLAADGTVDVENLTDEQAEALANEVLAQDPGTTVETEEEEAPVSEDPEQDAAFGKAAAAYGLSKTAFATADKMGRVMAHSFHQEREQVELEKDAGARMGKVVEHLKGMAGKAKGGVGAAAGKVKDVAKGTAMAGAYTAGKALGKAKKHPGAVGAALGAAAGAGGATAVHKAKEKKSSGLDTLAARRALEILEANGVKLETEQEVEKTSGAYDVLASKVEERAMELLREQGFQIEAPTEEQPQE